MVTSAEFLNLVAVAADGGHAPLPFRVRLDHPLRKFARSYAVFREMGMEDQSNLKLTSAHHGELDLDVSADHYGFKEGDEVTLTCCIALSGLPDVSAPRGDLQDQSLLAMHDPLPLLAEAAGDEEGPPHEHGHQEGMVQNDLGNVEVTKGPVVEVDASTEHLPVEGRGGHHQVDGDVVRHHAHGHSPETHQSLLAMVDAPGDAHPDVGMLSGDQDAHLDCEMALVKNLWPAETERTTHHGLEGKFSDDWQFDSSAMTAEPASLDLGRPVFAASRGQMKVDAAVEAARDIQEARELVKAAPQENEFPKAGLLIHASQDVPQTDLPNDSVPEENLARFAVQEDVQEENHGRFNDPGVNHVKEDVPEENFAQEDVPEEHHANNDVPEKNLTEDDVPEENLAQADPSAENVVQDDVPEENLAKTHPAEENLAQDDVSEENLAQERVPEENFKQDDVPEQNLAQEQGPEDNFKQDDAPEQNLAQEQVPDEILTHDDVPEQNLAQEQGPEDNFKQDDAPEQNLAQEQVPDEILTHDDVPEQNLAQERFREKHSAPCDVFGQNLAQKDLEQNLEHEENPPSFISISSTPPPSLQTAPLHEQKWPGPEEIPRWLCAMEGCTSRYAREVGFSREGAYRHHLRALHPGSKAAQVLELGSRSRKRLGCQGTAMQEASLVQPSLEESFARAAGKVFTSGVAYPVAEVGCRKYRRLNGKCAVSGLGSRVTSLAPCVGRASNVTPVRSKRKCGVASPCQPDAKVSPGLMRTMTVSAGPARGWRVTAWLKDISGRQNRTHDNEICWSILSPDKTQVFDTFQSKKSSNLQDAVGEGVFTQIYTAVRPQLLKKISERRLVLEAKKRNRKSDTPPGSDIRSPAPRKSRAHAMVAVETPAPPPKKHRRMQPSLVQSMPAPKKTVATPVPSTVPCSALVSTPQAHQLQFTAPRPDWSCGCTAHLRRHPRCFKFGGTDLQPALIHLASCVVVGRHDSSDVVLDSKRTPGMISRRHAVVQFQAHACLLTDQGGVNGVMVNGERVRERVLAHGDVITFGVPTPQPEFDYVFELRAACSAFDEDMTQRF